MGGDKAVRVPFEMLVWDFLIASSISVSVNPEKEHSGC